ncbi:hypothetical protein [Kitasatospora cheerisanensis]|uniref:Uncharacterized protein n=1 Tax=Kitasatospora cheerisanensis KCTC 2395 TaxID=1348663 RepID=A0A066YRN5_9ACTN|nr:hypothetical protein [Kitasatospora cheerisanensis]KDN83907.1 hypothetical protein KCH_45560 [Kitasatospora cheerisanensis KCTC 2395]
MTVIEHLPPAPATGGHRPLRRLLRLRPEVDVTAQGADVELAHPWAASASTPSASAPSPPSPNSPAPMPTWTNSHSTRSGC